MRILDVGRATLILIGLREILEEIGKIPVGNWRKWLLSSSSALLLISEKFLLLICPVGVIMVSARGNCCILNRTDALKMHF